MVFLVLMALLEMIAGVVIVLSAPTAMQEIAGLIAFGFGVLTMAVMYGVRTIQELWKER